MLLCRFRQPHLSVLTQTGVHIQRTFRLVSQLWLMQRLLCPSVCECVSECVFLRWASGGGHVSLDCGGKNTVIEETAGVKWDVNQWAAGVTSSGFSGFEWGTQLMYTHTKEKNRDTYPSLSVSHQRLFEMTVKPQADLLTTTHRDTDSNMMATDHR